MNLNNAYKIYCLLYKKHLYKKHHGGRKPMELKPCINNLTHSLLQEGEEMRQRGYGAPPGATKDISSTSSGEGRRIRSDSSRPAFSSPAATGAVESGTPQSTVSSISARYLYYQHTVSSISARYLYYQHTAFNQLKYFQPGRNHLSVPVVV
jgi:hypothetical protein